MNGEFLIGTAGWSIGLPAGGQFPAEGSSLERYAARFRCAEINSSFHRSHRPETWARWAGSVPDGFSFSAKLSKQITHGARLAAPRETIEAALAEMMQLGGKLKVVLVQLPPSLAFDEAVAAPFFESVRELWRGGLVCEPRHASWFEPEAEALLSRFEVARVAADPVRAPGADEPGGWRGLSYYRLHGSPVPYRSSYDDGRLEALAARLSADAGSRPVWCIFDNTASSAAVGDALKLERLLGS